ncbi:MAG: hypothetical protein IT532_11115 [Burkholderiales bacterium]|nr:hypothetical protein [Burkholderiales bacterium]
MPQPELLALLALFGALALFVVWEGAAVWRAAATQHDILPLQRVLERRGVRLRGMEDRVELQQFGQAARRCVICTRGAQCEAWLVGDASAPLEGFCPNASFVEGLSGRTRNRIA